MLSRPSQKFMRYFARACSTHHGAVIPGASSVVTQRITSITPPAVCLKLSEKLPPNSSVSFVDTLFKDLHLRKPCLLSPHETQTLLEFNLPNILNTNATGTIGDKSVLKEYTLPTPVSFKISPGSGVFSDQNPIGDPNKQSNAIGENLPIIKKEARYIQKLRRWRMNRHQLKKLRKRMLFTNRKLKHIKEKKKEKIFQGELDAIMNEAESFDAKQFVLKELETARRGGYKIDIWQTIKKKQSLIKEKYLVLLKKS